VDCPFPMNLCIEVCGLFRLVMDEGQYLYLEHHCSDTYTQFPWKAWLWYYFYFLLLDYSIRCSLPSSISPEFYGWIDREESSSIISESKSWVQFLPVTYFLPLRIIILTSLAVSLSTHMTRVRGHDSHVRGGMLDYSKRCPYAPSISHGFYG
jgi:hypothetical protein